MKHRYALILLFALSLMAAPRTFAATGFVDSPLLLSPESPKDGDTVTLSVLFHNAEAEKVSGTVLFYDGDTLLEKKNVNIDSGDVSIASTTFTIDAGIHKFSATMSDIGTTDSTGKLSVVVIPKATVTLPAELITRKIPTAAQADGTTTSSESVILDKVAAAQDAVLNAVPSGAKKAVTSSASSIDSVRASVAASLTASRDAAKAAADQSKKAAAPSTTKKTGTKAATPTASSGSPFAEVKYLGLAALAFFFSTPVVFYIGGILLAYFLVRFIYRRIRKARGGV